jgi:hypothetical protein
VASGKKRGKRAGRRPAPGDAARATASDPIAPPSPAPRLGEPPRTWRWLVLGAGALTVLAAVAPWGALGLPGAWASSSDDAAPALALLTHLFALPLAALSAVAAIAPGWRSRLAPLTMTLAFGALALASSGAIAPGLNPFGAGYDGFWGAPLPALLAAFAALALGVARAGVNRGWLVLGLVTLGLFFLTPIYHLGQVSLPLVELGLRAARGEAPAMNLLAMLTPVPVALTVVAALRGHPRTLPAALALTAWAPLAALTGALGGGGTSALSLAPAFTLGGLVLMEACWSATPAAPVDAARVESSRWIRWAAPLLVAALFFLLKSHALLPSTTDENIYFYMANLIAQGQLPYRDFFFAHPPLHIAVPALVFAVTGFQLVVAKLIPVLAAMLSGLLVYRIARRAGGAATAVVALVLFFFATEVLKASTNLTGINLSTAFLLAGVAAFTARRYVWAGALFALGAHTGFYIIAVPVTFGALLALGDRRALARYALGFFPLWLAIMGACALIGGESYWQGVYFYHWGKPAKNAAMLAYVDGLDPTQPVEALFHNLGQLFDAKMWRRTLYYHAHIFWGALLSAGWLLHWRLRRGAPGERRPWLRPFTPRDLFADPGDPTATGRLALIAFVALILEFSAFKELYEFYFVLMMPFAAILTALLVVDAGRRVVALAEARSPRVALPVAALGLFVLWLPVAAQANKVFPDELRDAGQRRQYQWSEPPILTPLAPIVRHLFWKDHRVKGEMELGVRHYLWNKKLYFSTAWEMADHIRANSREGDTITGGSLVAPLLALLSDRPLAANIVDTNAKTFWSDMTLGRAFPDITDPKARRQAIERQQLGQFFDRVCATPLRFVVVANRTYFNPRRVPKLQTLATHFAPDRSFEDKGNRHFRSAWYHLWKAKAEGDETCRNLEE